MDSQNTRLSSIASEDVQNNSVSNNTTIGANRTANADFSANYTRSREGYTNTRGSLEDDAEPEEGEGDEAEEEEEEITPAELIEKLQQCWLNEKFAPELLEHRTPVVECIIEQIKHMENNIKSAKKGDFRIAIHKLEIEQFAYAILDEDEKRSQNTRSKLSPEEYAYAIKYFKNVKSHLAASVLDHLPSNLQDLNEAVTMPKPDVDKFVFFRALDSVKGVMVDDLASDGRSEILDFDRNDLYIMRYRYIKDYVNLDQLQLI